MASEEIPKFILWAFIAHESDVAPKKRFDSNTHEPSFEQNRGSGCRG